MRRWADRLEIIVEIITNVIHERFLDHLVKLHDLQEKDRSLVNHDGSRVTALCSHRVLPLTLPTPSLTRSTIPTSL